MAEPSDREKTWRIHVLERGSGSSVGKQVIEGAEVALQDVSLLSKPVTVSRGRLTPVGLASLPDDPSIIAVITIGGSAEIAAAGSALDVSHLPVFEVTDDLYESGALRDSVFQVAAPHSWATFRMARYFGADDRRYSEVGIAREPGPLGDIAARTLSEALAVRRVQMVDASGVPDAVVETLSAAQPQAVVVEGSPAFRIAVAKAIAGRGYQGRAKIADGWRPQLVGFESMFEDEASTAPPPGTVISSDYARPADPATPVEAAKRFRRQFEDRFERPPVGAAVYGFDVASLVTAAVAKVGSNDSRAVVDELEKSDRARFGHLPISLSPSDHILAERDVMGLWTKPGSGAGWTQVMRTFTSDLERTNILEDDWPSFFPGADPKGEAPFYFDAATGDPSRPSNDLF